MKVMRKIWTSEDFGKESWAEVWQKGGKKYHFFVSSRDGSKLTNIFRPNEKSGEVTKHQISRCNNGYKMAALLQGNLSTKAKATLEKWLAAESARLGYSVSIDFYR